VIPRQRLLLGGLLSHFSASVTTCLSTPRLVKPCHFNYILARHHAHVRQRMPHLVNRTDTGTDTGFCANNLPEARLNEAARAADAAREVTERWLPGG
jgi:hypothetical protein